MVGGERSALQELPHCKNTWHEFTNNSECLQNHKSAVYTEACLNIIYFFYVVSGRIDASEIQQSLGELGMDISRENALKILQRFVLHLCPL